MVRQLSLHLHITSQIQIILNRYLHWEPSMSDWALLDIVFLTAAKFYTDAKYLSVIFILTNLGLVHQRAFLVELVLLVCRDPHGLLHHVVDALVIVYWQGCNALSVWVLVVSINVIGQN